MEDHDPEKDLASGEHASPPPVENTQEKQDDEFGLLGEHVSPPPVKNTQEKQDDEFGLLGEHVSSPPVKNTQEKQDEKLDLPNGQDEADPEESLEMQADEDVVTFQPPFPFPPKLVNNPIVPPEWEPGMPPPKERLGTLTAVIRHWATQDPNRPALVFRSPSLKGRTMLSFSDLYLYSRRYAKVLKDHGIRRGETVVVVAPNSPERAIVDCGIMFLCAVIVNGVCEMPGDEVMDLVSVMQRSRAVALLMDIDYYKGRWNKLKSYIQLLDYNGQATSFQMPHFRLFLRIRRRRPIGPGDLMYDMNHWYFDTFEGTPEPRPQDPCAIITTTGTAGHHRLVLHSHRNLVAFSRVMVPRTNSKTHGLYLNGPFGSAIGHLGLSMYTGMKRVVMDARAGTPLDMAEFVCLALWEEQCISAVIPPYLILQVAKKFVQTEAAKKIMFIGVTGEKVGIPTIEAALTIAQVAVVSLITSELFLSTLWMVTKPQEFRDCCVGAPIPSVQVRIVSDTGMPVSSEIKGNVEIRTPLIFRGYAHDLEATDACFTPDGYFKTNDLGWLEKGMLFVEGRRKDIITRGSLSFYPAWLEAAIEKCPGVVQAIVVGIPNEKLHQEICACVVTSNKDLKMTTIREFVENNFFKSPRPRYYLHFDFFPENQADKANRDEVALVAMRRLQ